MRDGTGNLPSLPDVFPDYATPVVRNGDGSERELTVMRWGMPSPEFVSRGRNVDSGVKSPHWRRWLGPANRCLVYFTSFSEYVTTAEAKKVPMWFAAGENRPLMACAGIWTNWTRVRKTKEGEVQCRSLRLPDLRAE